MALNADDAKELADRFLEAATAIDKFLDDNWTTIDRADYETMSESAKTLLRVCSFMTTVAVGLSIDRMQDDAAQLKQVTAKAKESLARLQSVRRAMRVAAGMVDLATAIMSKDPGGIFKAFQGLHELTQDHQA